MPGGSVHLAFSRMYASNSSFCAAGTIGSSAQASPRAMRSVLFAKSVKDGNVACPPGGTENAMSAVSTAVARSETARRSWKPRRPTASSSSLRACEGEAAARKRGRGTTSSSLAVVVPFRFFARRLHCFPPAASSCQARTHQQIGGTEGADAPRTALWRRGGCTKFRRRARL